MLMANKLVSNCLLGITLLILSACEPSYTTPVVLQTPPTNIGTTKTKDPVIATTSQLMNVPLQTPTAPSKEEAYSKLINLLQTNAGCQLPCWWGITPGVSTPSDAYLTLISFREIAYVGLLYPDGGVVDFKYHEKDLIVAFNVEYLSNVDGKTVKMLKIFTQTLRDLGNRSYENVYGSSVYNELLGSYSIDNMLSKYGRPSQVLVRADVYDYSQRETFEITLLYPETGIFARYNSVAERVGDKIRGCPSKAVIELWLLTPTEKDTYQEILSANDETWEENWPYTTPIQEATSMTVEDFYQMYKEPTDMCLDTPLNIWPKH